MRPRGFLVLLVCAVSSVSTARAQDALAEATAAFQRAAFAEAIEAYDRAAAGDGLDRDGVLALLEGRALARHAARDHAGAERDLAALLSLQPDATLGEMAPPALQRAFARLQGEVAGTIALSVEASRVPDGFAVRTRVQNDVASLVRAVRVHWESEGEWRRAEGRGVRVVAGSTLRFYVEAIGPGGAVLARHGSPDAPERAAAIEGGASPVEAPIEPASDDTALWVGVGVGAAVMVAVAVVLAVVLAPPDRTQPSAPMVLP